MPNLPDFNALMMQGYNAGREMRRQEGERGALAGVVNGDQNALGELATYNPQMAWQVKSHQDQQQLALMKQRKELMDQGVKAAGDAALLVANLPEAERPAEWDKQMDFLASRGFDGMLKFKGQYNQQNLFGLLAEAGRANEYRQATQPNYMAVPYEAELVNTRDAGELAAFGQRRQDSGQSIEPLTAAEAMGMVKTDPKNFLAWQARFKNPVRVTSPEEAAALPSGTLIISPDGRTKVKQ